jgi:type IV secretory pathway TrbD component
METSFGYWETGARMTEKAQGRAVPLLMAALAAVLVFVGLFWLAEGYGYGSGIVIGIIAFLSSMTARNVYGWLREDNRE